MDSIPSPIEAFRLLAAEVDRAIGATMTHATLKARPTFDGDGFDIAWEAVIFWSRPDRNPQTKAGPVEVGSHAGYVRANRTYLSMPHLLEAFEADIGSGHYARGVADYCIRAERLGGTELTASLLEEIEREVSNG